MTEYARWEDLEKKIIIGMEEFHLNLMIKHLIIFLKEQLGKGIIIFV